MTERDELFLSMMIQDAYSRPISAPETLIRGDIKHFHFPDLLLYLRRIQATGVLYISREKVRKKVYISAGIPTAAQSNLKHELIGEFLVSRGAITRDQQQEALKLHAEKKISFAAAAMELGAIGRTDLFNLARQHFLTILYSLFGLKRGTYRFDEQELPQVLFCYQVSFSRMLVFGLRLISDREVLLDMLGDLHKVAVPTDRFSEYIQIMFTDKEKAAIEQINSEKSLKEIIESSRTPSLTAMKALLILLYHGLIRFEVELDEASREELVDLEEDDTQLLGFQSYHPGRLEEERAVAGNDFLIPPYGIPPAPLEKEEPDQTMGGPEQHAALARDAETDLTDDSGTDLTDDSGTDLTDESGIDLADESGIDLADESVQRVDRLFSDRSTWIDTLLWGVAPVSKSREPQRDTNDGGSVEEDMTAEAPPSEEEVPEPAPAEISSDAASAHPPLEEDVPEPTPAEILSDVPSGHRPIELEQNGDTAPRADSVSPESLEEERELDTVAAEAGPWPPKTSGESEESPIVELVDSVDEAEKTVEETEDPLSALASPVETGDREPGLLTRTVSAVEPDLSDAETRLTLDSAPLTLKAGKPLYWTAFLLILGFGIYALWPEGRETPEPVPEVVTQAVEPVGPDTRSLGETVPATEEETVPATEEEAVPATEEGAVPATDDESVSTFPLQDVFSGSPTSEDTAAEEEEAVPPMDIGAPQDDAPLPKGAPIEGTEAAVPEEPMDADPVVSDLADQSAETTSGPQITEGPVPPALVVEEFRLLVNGQPTRVPAGAALVVSPADTLVIEGVIPTPSTEVPLKINFVGFVGNKTFNDADDRGYTIRTGDLMRRRALDAQGTIYRIEATVGRKRVAEIFIRIRR